MFFVKCIIGVQIRRNLHISGSETLSLDKAKMIFANIFIYFCISFTCIRCYAICIILSITQNIEREDVSDRIN